MITTTARIPVFAGLRRHLDIWRTSWQEAKRETLRRRPQGKELEFLPAVLELQETPPSPVGRAIAYSIMALFAVGVLWATVGRIDIIAVAQGKVVPSHRSKVVQPLESGIVKAIYVQDGARVKQGQPLVELDTTAGADRERYSNERLAALTEIARLRALLANRDTFDAPKGADPAFVQIQRDRLRNQLAEYRALQHQAEVYKQMVEKQYVAQMQYLDVEQKRAAKAQEYGAALADAETRAHSLTKELQKATTRASQQYLTAPLDGIVQQLAIHTVGGVVTPAQQLMVIAPQEDQLEIEAWVENKDIGFVSEHQQAEIKIESFPFTRYGTLTGQVLTLSGDAVPIENVGLVYTARVAMDKHTVDVGNGREVRLSPGMAVSVEIKTGNRRVIEYLLSPLLRGVKEAARER